MIDCEGFSLRLKRRMVVSSARMGFSDGYFEDRKGGFAKIID